MPVSGFSVIHSAGPLVHGDLAVDLNVRTAPSILHVSMQKLATLAPLTCSFGVAIGDGRKKRTRVDS